MKQNKPIFPPGSQCFFPHAWHGDYFHLGFGSPLVVSNSTISEKGRCVESFGSHYVMEEEDRGEKCWRCMTIFRKHHNVLQYKESEFHLYYFECSVIDPPNSRLLRDLLLHLPFLVREHRRRLSYVLDVPKRLGASEMPLQGPLHLLLQQGRVRPEPVQLPQELPGLLLGPQEAPSSLPGLHRCARQRVGGGADGVPGPLEGGLQALHGGRDEPRPCAQRRDQVQVLRVREGRQGGQQDGDHGPEPFGHLQGPLVSN